MRVDARVSVADPEVRQALTSFKSHLESAISVGDTPGSSHDRTRGFQPGFFRIDSTATAYIAMSVADGAAQWKAIGTIGGGPITAAVNGGIGGVGVYDSVSGSTLTFRNINVGSSKISVALDAGNKEIDIDAVEANFTHDNIGGILGLAKGGTGANLAPLVANSVIKATSTTAMGASGVLIDSSNYVTGIEKLTIDGTNPGTGTTTITVDPTETAGKGAINIAAGATPGSEVTRLEISPDVFGAAGAPQVRFFDGSTGRWQITTDNTLTIIPANGKYVVFEATATDSGLKIGTTTGFLKRTSGVVSSVTTIPASGFDFADVSVQIANRVFSGPPKDHIHHASAIAYGTVATARLGSGTADSTTFLRGDQTWATPVPGDTFDPVRNAVFMGAPRAHRHLAVDLIGQIDYLQLPFLPATSVFGNPFGTTEIPTSIAASGDGQVLKRTAGVLTFAQVDISSDTNLSATAPIILTGDALSFQAENVSAILACQVFKGPPKEHVHHTSAIVYGTMATGRLGSGTADATTYLRGDSTWAAVAAGSSFDAIQNEVFSGPPKPHMHWSFDFVDKDQPLGVAGLDAGGSVPPTHGGTGRTSWTANALLVGFDAAGTLELAVNATATRKFLRQVSSGTPAYDTLLAADTTDFNEGAQDAVGTILVDSTTVDFTYTDATPSITADVKMDQVILASQIFGG